MRGYNERLHWCIFNVIVRLFGIIATFFAVAAIGWGVYFFTHPSVTKKEEAKQWVEYRGAKQTWSHKTLGSPIRGQADY